MQHETIGLLVMAYGTPRTLGELEPYYTHIRHGGRPPEALLQELRDRYLAIGGASPLNRITGEQAAALTRRLGERFPTRRFRAYVGLKHTAPFIEDAVESMHRDGIRDAVALVMAPHDSTFSIQVYNRRAQQAAREWGIPRLRTTGGWYRQPKFIACWARYLQIAMASLSTEERRQTMVLFSAHSLPLRILGTGDPYVGQVEESARLIAAAAGVAEYATGWQSAGRTPEPWIGPDVRDLSRDLCKSGNYRTFIFCPIGFVADHLEVLYDNDVECRALMAELGTRYLRPPMPNANPLFIDALGDVAAEALADTVSAAA